MPSQESYGDVLLRVIEEVVAPGALAIDAAGTFPRVQANARAAAGLLGLPLPGEA